MPVTPGFLTARLLIRWGIEPADIGTPLLTAFGVDFTLWFVMIWNAWSLWMQADRHGRCVRTDEDFSISPRDHGVLRSIGLLAVPLSLYGTCFAVLIYGAFSRSDRYALLHTPWLLTLCFLSLLAVCLATLAWICLSWGLVVCGLPQPSRFSKAGKIQNR
jgi:cation transporter-like permease